MEKKVQQVFQAGDFRIPIGKKTYVMGIINVTPDSFSDGGRFFSTQAAEQHASDLVEAGADFLDIGGESTRPGHTPVGAEEEMNRVIPVIRRIAPNAGIPISVDTSKAVVAEKAVDAGASVINDVWGLRKDPDIARIAFETKVGLVLMFNATDDLLFDHSGDIVADAISYLSGGIETALRAGVDESQILLDPGIGFGMSHVQSFELIRGIGRLKELGYPVLVGPSRKRFIGAALGNIPTEQRDEGTAAVSCLAAYIGADVIRVHNVKSVIQSLIIADTIARKKEE
ncbi:MAG: dihydropteroate synthase [Clostridiales bacterium]|nr:dihydropteroate synthase [Clostridiales bacterium]